MALDERTSSRESSLRQKQGASFVNEVCPVEVKAKLTDKKTRGHKEKRDLGYLTLSVHILPAADAAAEEILRRRHSSQMDEELETKSKRRSGIRQGSKMWTDLVRIVLIGARNLVDPSSKNANSSEYSPDTCVKFKLGGEKSKSKIVYDSRTPQWLEQFNLHVRNDDSQILEVVLVDVKKDVLIGRCELDLTELPGRKSVKNWYRLDNGVTEVLLSLSYSGKLASRTVSACDTEEGLVHRFDEAATPEVIRSYDWKNTLWNYHDVGFLVVKVHKARELKAADLGITSDPFCVVELCNARLETHTEHKTTNPDWYTMFTFFVTDIHAILEVTVCDEDRYKSEFLGKVGIPLLNIVNNELIWYPLKNQQLTRRVKGEILLEMNIVWNPIRAALATLVPPERKYGAKEDPFRPRVCIRNLERLNRFAVMAYDWYQYWQFCLSWESPQLSILAFLVCLIVANFVQPCMVPLGPLFLFVMYFWKREVGDVTGGWTGSEDGNDNGTELGFGHEPTHVTAVAPDEDDETAEEDETVDERNWKTIRSYIRNKEVSLCYIQNLLDLTATYMEKTKNILEFKQPFVSWLAVFCLSLSVAVMYFIPLRYLAMAWVIKKFTRKVRRPHAVHSNEVMDFIARAPSDIDLKSYCGYRRGWTIDEYSNAKTCTHAANRKHDGSVLSKLKSKLKGKSRD